MSVPVSAIVAAIDRYGADLATWPERDLAKAARLAMLADPDVRAWLDDARRLESDLDRARASLDEEIARSGAPERVAAAVQAAAARTSTLRPRWAAIAATLVIAAGLGAAVELTTGAGVSNQSFNVVTLDPLVFGPTGFDQQ
jgi:hypothetical protein